MEFGVKPQDGVTTTFKYTERLKHRLDWSYRKAKEVSEREAKRNKRRYDRRIRCTKLQKGDLVLVRQKAYKGKHKIADRWENEPYEVICQIDKRFPVYKVQCKGSEPKTRVLHRNLLFPIHQDCDNMGVEQTECLDVEPADPMTEEATNEQESDQEDQVDLEAETEDSDTETYEAPMTRSRKKALDAVLSKSNQITNPEDLGQNFDFSWTQCRIQ